VFCRQNVLFWLVLGAGHAGGRQCSFDLVVRPVNSPAAKHGESRDPGITRQITSPAAWVIADEAWAKLLWAGLKLHAVGFGNADSYYPQSGSTRMTEASALTKRRDAASPARTCRTDPDDHADLAVLRAAQRRDLPNGAR